MNPYHHALSSTRRYGGDVEDYLPLHQWFDESKALFPDVRHRALRHHAEGILGNFLAERIFGVTLTNSEGRVIPVRFIGEQHVKEDLGRIPTVPDWLECIRPRPWMLGAGGCPEPEDALNPLGEVCECEQPGHFRSGVPGIIARLEDGRLAPGAKVDRCDLCRRYPSDEAAYEKLVELGAGRGGLRPARRRPRLDHAAKDRRSEVVADEVVAAKS